MFIERHYLIGAIFLIIFMSTIDWSLIYQKFFSCKDLDALQELIQFKILNGELGREIRQTCPVAEIFKNLLEIEKTEGVNIESSLKELRLFVHEKRKFFKKKNDRIISATFHLIFLNLFIGLYIVMINTQLSLEFNYWVILSSMFFGLWIIRTILESTSKYLLDDLISFYCEIMKLKVLMNSTQAANEIFEQIDLTQMESLRCSRLKNLKKTLLNALRTFKANGKNIGNEVDLIISELNYEISERFQRFDEISKTIKMISIVLFILPVFFMVNYKILERII